jgi:hypothetical protein
VSGGKIVTQKRETGSFWQRTNEGGNVMKNRVVAFLVTGFLVCAALVSYTYGTGRSTVQPASFEFVVDWDASEVSFERHHGTDWLTLKWRESGDGVEVKTLFETELMRRK